MSGRQLDHMNLLKSVKYYCTQSHIFGILLPAATVSSPMNLWPGNSFPRFVMSSFSTCWSVSVTKSISHDLVTIVFDSEIFVLISWKDTGKSSVWAFFTSKVEIQIF